MIMKINLGKNIYKLRKKNGISQEQLAESLGVSRQTIYKWETNLAIPRSDKLVDMVDIFKVSYNDLFNEHLFKEDEFND